MSSQTFYTAPTLAQLGADLAAGRTTSRALVEDALALIADPAGEGKRVFLKVYEREARAAADAQDLLRGAGLACGPLAGIPISIKDLCDVAGEPTTAGSTVLRDAPPAVRDAPVVARLRAAGAVIVGKTNMTEFAYSGVGINPHYGTPGNPHDRACVPGGSSSGAAVSVADGMAAVGLGSDTGGSVRLPAALCGLVGFKPTASRIPRSGVSPLSTTLDSLGPLARSTACCAIFDAVLAGEEPVLPEVRAPGSLRLAVPKTLVLDGLAPEVAGAFERACAALRRAGATLVDVTMPELGEVLSLNTNGGFSAAEAYAWHETLLATRSAEYDPRVGSRIVRGRDITAVQYIALLERRAALIAASHRSMVGFDAMIMPTVAITAPPIAAFATDAEYLRLNLLLLRNTTLINLLDGTGISIPIQAPGAAPVGLTLAGNRGGDRTILSVALGVEPVLRKAAA
jgi:aspartyl-tRNA(Asn)/glutamyl-tRNA(Gln) amidotransferase subunit A